MERHQQQWIGKNRNSAAAFRLLQQRPLHECLRQAGAIVGRQEQKRSDRINAQVLDSINPGELLLAALYQDELFAGNSF